MKACTVEMVDSPGGKVRLCGREAKWFVNDLYAPRNACDRHAQKARDRGYRVEPLKKDVDAGPRTAPA